MVEAGERQLLGAKAAADRLAAPRRRSTDRPARAIAIAAASPLGPEPTTTASCTFRGYPVAFGLGFFPGSRRGAWSR